MNWWKRKSDGFVWREHVRTTIVVRRDQRRQRLEDIKAAAVEGVKDAGAKGAALGVAGVRIGAAGAAAGAKLGAAGAQIGAVGLKRAATGMMRGAYLAAMAVADIGVAILIATWLWMVDTAGPAVAAVAKILSDGIGRLAAQLGRLAAPGVQMLRHPLATPVLALVAIAAVGSAAARISTTGFDTDAQIAAFVAGFGALLLAVAHWPRIATGAVTFAAASGLDRVTLPAGVRRSGSALGIVAGLAAIISLGAVFDVWSGGWRSLSNGAVAVVQGGASLIAPGSTIEGRAAAVSGIRLRVAGTDVQLSGIEAPESGQMCGQRTCATQAKAALQKLVQGKRATCAVSGTADGEGQPASATCTIDGADLAAQLVRGGNVFATAGFFASYDSQEREAKNSKLGVWRAGADRPAEYRSRVYDEARKSAPDGCPIKGVINGTAKTYVAPWSAGYDKTKVRTSRGERWFCSEEDARAAGWKAAAGS